MYEMEGPARFEELARTDCSDRDHSRTDHRRAHPFGDRFLGYRTLPVTARVWLSFSMT